MYWYRKRNPFKDRVHRMVEGTQISADEVIKWSKELQRATELSNTEIKQAARLDIEWSLGDYILYAANRELHKDQECGRYKTILETRLAKNRKTNNFDYKPFVPDPEIRTQILAIIQNKIKIANEN